MLAARMRDAYQALEECNRYLKVARWISTPPAGSSLPSASSYSSAISSNDDVHQQSKGDEKKELVVISSSSGGTVDDQHECELKQLYLESTVNTHQFPSFKWKKAWKKNNAAARQAAGLDVELFRYHQWKRFALFRNESPNPLSFPLVVYAVVELGNKTCDAKSSDDSPGVDDDHHSTDIHIILGANNVGQDLTEKIGACVKTLLDKATDHDGGQVDGAGDTMTNFRVFKTVVLGEDVTSRELNHPLILSRKEPASSFIGPLPWKIPLLVDPDLYEWVQL